LENENDKTHAGIWKGDSMRLQQPYGLILTVRGYYSMRLQQPYGLIPTVWG